MFFVSAFAPLAGAVLARIVALVTGGTGAAIAVTGRFLSLHPMVVLFSVVAGGALFGITARCWQSGRRGRRQLREGIRAHQPQLRRHQNGCDPLIERPDSVEVVFNIDGRPSRAHVAAEHCRRRSTMQVIDGA